MTYLALLAIGAMAGIMAGMFGIGGGLIIVPALLYIIKLNEFEALGTSLALVPPVGLLGAIEYYRHGHIHLHYAAFVAIGLFFGAYFGAKLVMPLPPATINRLYGALLLLVAVRMLFFGK